MRFRVREFGLFLASDKTAPSLVGLIVGAPVRGSWWAHPLCHEIYMVSQRLRDHTDVAVLKFVSGKTTYLHRSRWPELFALAMRAMRGRWMAFTRAPKNCSLKWAKLEA